MLLTNKCLTLLTGLRRHDDKKNIVPAFWSLHELRNSFAVWLLGEPEENSLPHGAWEDTLVPVRIRIEPTSEALNSAVL